MHSWPSRYYGYVLRDALLNLLLYIPLGVCACMVFRRRMQPAPAAVLAVLVGFLLSSAIEIAQAYEATRDSSLMDITTNTAGSAVGALLAAVFSHQAHSHRMKAIDPTAATLFALWLISLLFPFVPEHSFAILVNKLNAFWTFSPVAFTSAVLGWYLAGTLLSEAGAPNATVWIFASTLSTPLQMLISPHQPTAAMLFGAIAGAVLFTFLRGRETRSCSPWPSCCCWCSVEQPPSYWHLTQISSTGFHSPISLKATGSATAPPLSRKLSTVLPLHGR